MAEEERTQPPDAGSAPAGGRARPVRRFVVRHPGEAVAALAVAARLPFLLAAIGRPSLFTSIDAAQYLRMADVPSGYWDAGAANWDIGFRRPPGYPALMVIPQHIGNGSTASGIVQLALGALAAWLTWVAGRELAGPAVGLVAGLWTAVEPLTLIHSTRLLSEAPYSALVAGTLFLLTRACRRASLRLAAAGGFVLGYATLVRPISLYLPVLLVPAIVLVLRRTVGTGRSLRVGAAVLVAFLVPVGGWIARNQATSGVATISTIEGINLLDYRAAASIAEEDGEPLGQARGTTKIMLARRVTPGMNVAQVAQEKSKLGRQLILDHPAGYAQQAAKGLGRLLFGPGGTQATAVTEDAPAGDLIGNLLVIASAVSAVAMLIGGLAGTVVGIRRHDVVFLLLTALPLAYLLVVGSGQEADARFRLPLVPLLTIMSGYALVYRSAGRVTGGVDDASEDVVDASAEAGQAGAEVATATATAQR